MELSHFFRQLKQFRKFVLWAPVLSLITGLMITALTYNYMKQRDEGFERTNFTHAAREELIKIDLLLTNNILKIQSYENNLESKPSNYVKDTTYLTLALRHTLFQRVSIYRDSKNNSGLKLLLRINTEDSNLLINDYLQSEALKQTVAYLNKTSGRVHTVLYERDHLPQLSVVVRSAIYQNIYFVFTAPLINLFNQTVINPNDSILVSSPASKNSWLIRADALQRKFSEPYFDFENRTTKKINSKHKLIFTNSLPQSNVDVGFQFNYSPPRSDFLSSDKIVALFGSLLTIAISYLFYNLITQNRDANLLIITKTLDLEKTAHDLQDALNSKANFFGKISHEIRTPLNLILGMIDLCQEINTDKSVRAYLKTMQSSGEHLLSMLDDLLDLAKSENNEITIQERTIYLAQFVGDVAKLAGQDCRSKNLKLYVHFDKDMPSSIITDPNRLRQVLLNLLRNASKYTAEGHIIISVHSVIEENKIKLQFEIQDTGIGIPSDKLTKVFDAFFQVENSKAYAEGGVGLGLSIVKDIVRKMHGKIRVKSTPNVGTTFLVSLEFAQLEKNNWLETYKNEKSTDFNLVVLSDDPLFQKSVASLSGHPNLKEITYITSNYERVFTMTDKENLWVVCDNTTSAIDLEHLKQTFGKKVFSVDAHPFLPYELLNAIGLSTKIKKRFTSFEKNDQNQNYLSETQSKALVVKDDLSIIVADDDYGNIELYKAYMSQKPWVVDYHYDGITAWQGYEKHTPDLLILDVRMPNMDGFQLIEKIRSYERAHHLKSTPVILVTADLLDYTAKMAKTFDQVTLLAKPLKKSLMMETIQKVMTEN